MEPLRGTATRSSGGATPAVTWPLYCADPVKLSTLAPLSVQIPTAPEASEVSVTEAVTLEPSPMEMTFPLAEHDTVKGVAMGACIADTAFSTVSTPLTTLEIFHCDAPPACR